jgi:AraC-like DNA-binding protein
MSTNTVASGKPMKLLYAQEHLSCVNYVTNKSIGFSIHMLLKGDVFALPDKSENYIVFLTSGKLELNFNKVGVNELNAEEMVLIPIKSEGTGKVLENSSFILLAFDSEHLNLCDKFSIDDVLSSATPEDGIARPLPIYPPMQMVLDSVNFFLSNNISCIHLHEIKQKEAFLILRAFYTKEENASLFAPLLQGSKVNLPEFVRINYLKVRTAEELAKRYDVDFPEFAKKFVEAFGVDPQKWMDRRKAEMICADLKVVDIPMENISKKFLFESLEEFNNFCIKNIGKTPVEYRNQNGSIVMRDN